MAATHVFSKDEELANAITHGIGALISIACLTLLIVFASLYGNVWHIVSFSIYGTSMLILYASSTLVHSFPPGKAKDLFEILDHSAIYLFIAGTYTPILFIVVQGVLGWTLFGIIWGIATLGIVFKIFFVKKFLVISTVFYLLMGWMAMFAIKPIVMTLPLQGTLFLIGGGVLYSLGTVFYIWRGFKFHHAVWHLFVLGGTILHFFLVIKYILPIQ
ncbi:PAQR family membrane homeostasis protein TrhA [Alkalicoccobacillus plakortidis]|uniref:Hemolysin III family protein n=1 Tax=Alkalicoccobacillus plakortidis TaxID=444060 RepID=A0ABT0XGL7_9BACI|nr:hemolysin III family protein [Alkalicoccobacillus plakortidis]MCM2675063.1 hemolysin III family protein [Alkalicoccobacillus plakortidis]